MLKKFVVQYSNFETGDTTPVLDGAVFNDKEAACQFAYRKAMAALAIMPDCHTSWAEGTEGWSDTYMNRDAERIRRFRVYEMDTDVDRQPYEMKAEVSYIAETNQWMFVLKGGHLGSRQIWHMVPGDVPRDDVAKLDHLYSGDRRITLSSDAAAVPVEKSCLFDTVYDVVYTCTSGMLGPQVVSTHTTVGGAVESLAEIADQCVWPKRLVRSGDQKRVWELCIVSDTGIVRKHIGSYSIVPRKQVN